MQLGRVLLVAAFVVGVLTVSIGAVIQAAGGPDRDPGGPRVVDRALASSPLDVLRGWDERRAAAYARGDLRALDSLYADGSAAGRRDHRVLHAYLRRGLRITGLRTQILAADVRRSTARRLVVVVTDRVSAATAVGRGQRIALPRSSPRSRRVTLRAAPGGWRVVEVRDAP